MKTTGPIDGNVCLTVVQLDGTTDATTGTDLTKFEQAIKHWTILTDIIYIRYMIDDLYDVYHINDNNDLCVWDDDCGENDKNRRNSVLINMCVCVCANKHTSR